MEDEEDRSAPEARRTQLLASTVTTTGSSSHDRDEDPTRTTTRGADRSTI